MTQIWFESKVTPVTNVVSPVAFSFLTFLSFQVPEVLKKYMPEKYQDEIPFVKPAPIEVEAASKKAKKPKDAKPSA